MSELPTRAEAGPCPRWRARVSPRTRRLSWETLWNEQGWGGGKRVPKERRTGSKRKANDGNATVGMDVKRMLPMTLKGTEGSRGRRQIREDQTFSKRKSKFMLDQSAILLNKKKKTTLKNDGASLFTALRGGSTSHEFTSGEIKREVVSEASQIWVQGSKRG